MAVVVTVACILSAVTTLKYTSVILQSLGRSNQCNSILWLSKGYSKRDIPIRCLLLLSTFQIIISSIGNSTYFLWNPFIFPGSYDLLCIPTTVFYLFAYAVFNFYVFLVKLADPGCPTLIHPLTIPFRHPISSDSSFFDHLSRLLPRLHLHKPSPFSSRCCYFLDHLLCSALHQQE